MKNKILSFTAFEAQYLHIEIFKKDDLKAFAGESLLSDHSSVYTVQQLFYNTHAHVLKGQQL